MGQPELLGGEDEDLARRAALGDRAAFATIYARHGEAMFRYAVRMLDGEVRDAEDALQNVWIKVWKHVGDFRGQAQLRTWLFTITAHEVRDVRRRRRPIPVEDVDLENRAERADLGPARQAGHRHLREALDEALTELPWRQRASWLLFEVEGLSYSEIATVLQTSPTVVRGQLHRARRTLAIRMAAWR